MSLSTIGSIANHIAKNFEFPTGISGNLVEIVDASRINVQNFTGDTIGSDSISEKYQHAILWHAQADAIDLLNSQSWGDKIKLDTLEVENKVGQMSAQQFRDMADRALNNLGRNVSFGKTLV